MEEAKCGVRFPWPGSCNPPEEANFALYSPENFVVYFESKSEADRYFEELPDDLKAQASIDPIKH